MPPRNVSSPVAMTTAVAEPLSTLVPRNAMSSQIDGRRPMAPSCSASNFSTGKLSPVSALCVTKRSLAETMRTSAGIMSPAASSTTSPGDQLRDEDFLRPALTDRGGGERDHRLQLRRRAAGPGFLEEFQPDTEGNHERHHDSSPWVAGRKRDAGQYCQQNDERVQNRVHEQPAETHSLVFCQNVRAIVGLPRASVVARQPFAARRERRQDSRRRPRRGVDQDLRYLSLRGFMPDGGEEFPWKNGMRMGHAHLAVWTPRIRDTAPTARTRSFG